MASFKQQPLPMQQVDLYGPIMNTRHGPPPLAIRVGCRNQNSISEGVPNGQVKAETYVLLSALPEELRRRVELAVQALIAGR
jgi:hypothetical protein